jgi:ferredoxin
MNSDEFELRIEPLGVCLKAAADQPLWTTARDAGVALPKSCRNGTCRICMCRLISGQVTYRIDWPGLSADEKREGFILPCVAYPASDVVIEAPLAKRSEAP